MGDSRARLLTPLVLAATALTLMVTATVAGASHPRPKGATPLRASLVPAYTPCGAPNRTHGPPLAFPSCNPPVPESNFLTVGTPDANGAAANSVGFFSIRVIPGADENIAITASMSDVRCLPSNTGACGNANSAGGRDYVGQLQVEWTVRLTDHFNATAPGGGTDPATLVDIPSPVTIFCAGTADPSTGGVCTSTTGMCPVDGCSTIDNGDRTIAEFGQIRVLDGGSDGQMGTSGNTVFARQGLFIP